jgi:hypothetical protein
MPKMPKVRAKRKIKMEDVFEGVRPPPSPQSRKSPLVVKGLPSSSRRERSPRRLPPQTQQRRTLQPYAQKS